MPELPEVEAARLAATKVAAGRRIVSVWCADDSIVFGGVRAARFRAALTGRRVRAIHRRGKHLWFELDRRPWPALHFGMTGGIHTPAVRSVKLKSSRRRDPGNGWPPRFVKLRLVFDDGGELAIADARRLGRIRLRRDPPNEPPISLLGFDALHEVPPLRRFTELLRKRAMPIKALLLDQGFSAGVGNWIADEVLYQARIDPRRRASTLSEDEARRLRAKLQVVIRTAVKAGSDSDRFPRSWLFHYRWDRRRLMTTARGERIRYNTIGGRTTAWAPAVQH
jgi:formamidopyrimidine-DNA glycosylase